MDAEVDDVDEEVDDVDGEATAGREWKEDVDDPETETS